ncbi:MAG: hemerythrin domain-containing protein [Nitrososphaerota archaeon]|nr:hemerythrin domain-containing protein [Nitrososphaerota archaeon]
MTLREPIAWEEVRGLAALVGRLVEEHRGYASDMEELGRLAEAEEKVETLRRPFASLQDRLTEHMLVEESEVYPEVMRRDHFDSTVSTVMQQHHDVTASLARMEFSLRIGKLPEFRSGLEGLSAVLRSHQPAEEEKVFPLLFD